MSIRTAIVESHPRLCRDMLTALREHTAIEVTTVIPDISAIQQLEEIQPDVIVAGLDWKPARLDPFGIVAALQSACPEAELLLILHPDDAFLVHTLALDDLHGFLFSDDEETLTLGQAVEGLARGDHIYSQRALKALRASAHPNLTTYETKVLQRVADGLSNWGIAQDLHVSAGAIRNVMSKIYEKLGVVSDRRFDRRVDAINRARKARFVRSE